MLAPNIWGSSVWNLLLITQLAPTVVRWLLDFVENLYSPAVYCRLSRVLNVCDLLLRRDTVWTFLVNDQRDAQIPFYVFIFIYNSLHVSSISCSSSGETNCINTTSGNCHSVLVAVSCAGWESTPNLHMTRPPTQSESYQRLYWYNLSLLIMSTICSKHVESYK